MKNYVSGINYSISHPEEILIRNRIETSIDKIEEDINNLLRSDFTMINSVSFNLEGLLNDEIYGDIKCSNINKEEILKRVSNRTLNYLSIQDIS